MSTPLTDSINALTAYANETTGKQDTTLSDAVGSLVEGYGRVGLVKSEYMASYTVETSWENNTDGNPINVFNTVSSALGIDANDLAPTQAFILVFRNNNASSYKVDFIYRTKEQNYGSYSLRGNREKLRGYNTSVSTWATIGTIIDVYKLTYNLP